VKVATFEFTWDPSEAPETVLRDLREHVEELCVEELGAGP